MDVTGKKIAAYVFMPQIFPRMWDLFASGFVYIPYFMALVYRAVGLLPVNHPYLRPENRQRYGMTHVIAEAARHLRFDFKYIDKIIVFFALLFGAVIMILQLIATATTLFIQAAHATIPNSFTGFFVTDPPTHDIAFVLLERVFGVPGATTTGFFNTCVSQGIICFENIVTDDDSSVTDMSLYTGGFPNLFHQALHNIMGYYSSALLIVAVLIFIYFIFAIAAETAQTGTPFGKRFNRVFAPLRMVMALGLLIPMANGLNSAQYITLYMAKWGSSFATNGWKLVNDSLANDGSTLLGDPATLVAYPSIPPINTLVEFATAMSTCVLTTYRNSLTDPNGPKIVNAYIVTKDDPATAPTDPGFIPLAPTAYLDALSFSRFQNVIIRFGHTGTDANGDPLYPDQLGYVEPTCGEIIITITSLEENKLPGTWLIQLVYYLFIKDLWDHAAFSFVNASGDSCNENGIPDTTRWHFCDIALSYANNLWKESSPNTNSPVPDQAAIEMVMTFYDTLFRNPVISTCDPACAPGVPTDFATEAVDAQTQNFIWLQDLNELGWAGAGIWYNKVARINGSLFTAAYNLPSPSLYPMLMEEMLQRNKEENQSTTYWERFKPYLTKKITASTTDVNDYKEAEVLYKAQSLWQSVYPEAEGNIIEDFIMAIFGFDGLYAMTENKNNNVHPLAMLAGVGKSLVESSVRNIGFSAAAYGVGGISHILGMHNAGAAALTAGSLLSSIGMIGLSLGFVLFYIIPVMPFIYFFFAVGGWIKGIFEAMVGVPLWALAHIRIDGEGLPGDAAMNGYYLLLEIFIRPILIIFGLLAALQIFAAQVFVLHEIWKTVLLNVAGFNEEEIATDPTVIEFLRGKIDTFFYTVIYTLIVYMLAMSAFKLIDMIPNHILRWLGASVMTFGEGAGDPAEHLVRNTMMGTQHIGSKLTGVMQSAGSAGKSFGEAIHGRK